MIIGRSLAAVQYGAQSLADSKDTHGLLMAAQRDAPEVSRLKVIANDLCACSESPDVFVSCPARNCVGHAVVFLQIQTAAAVSPLFNYPGLISCFRSCPRRPAD